MLKEYDGNLFYNTLKNCRINICRLEPNKELEKRFITIYSFLNEQHSQEHTFYDIFGNIKENTVYSVCDYVSRFSYIFFLLPNAKKEPLLLIGPYLTEDISEEGILEIAEKLGLAPTMKNLLERYYGSLPIIERNSQLLVLLDTFFEQLWGADNYDFAEINQKSFDNIYSILQNEYSEPHEPIVNMQLMEERYAYENKLIDAVKSGQTHKADILFSNFSKFAFERRTADSIRDIKNYCIITNTILRKAAEQGGVHPIYLDSTSSAFAKKIENLPSISQAGKFMTEMFRSYCELVKKYSFNKYSSPVQKAIICIESNLSANLTLKHIANAINISGGYLSCVFKKETGKTITEYINEKRMELAKKLLVTTRLQIQAVAQHCGIYDVQYFSRIFKRYTGKTPNEFRKNA